MKTCESVAKIEDQITKIIQNILPTIIQEINKHFPSEYAEKKDSGEDSEELTQELGEVIQLEHNEHAQAIALPVFAATRDKKRQRSKFCKENDEDAGPQRSATPPCQKHFQTEYVLGEDAPTKSKKMSLKNQEGRHSRRHGGLPNRSRSQDINRTLPSHELFQEIDGPGQRSLHNVLEANWNSNMNRIIILGNSFKQLESEGFPGFYRFANKLRAVHKNHMLHEIPLPRTSIGDQFTIVPWDGSSPPYRERSIDTVYHVALSSLSWHLFDWHGLFECFQAQDRELDAPNSIEIDRIAEEIIKKIQIAQEKLEKSSYYGQIMEHLQNPEMVRRLQNVMNRDPQHYQLQVVVHGIGVEPYDEETNVETIHTQLAFALLLRKNFHLVKDIVVYHPNISPLEEKVISALNCTCVSANPYGRWPVDRPTLFFIPHCKYFLYDNILVENWTSTKLNNIIILGSSFNNFDHQLNDFHYNYTSRKIKAILKRNDILHEISLPQAAVTYSSMFIYNQMGGIDEAALDRLSLVTKMTNHIRVRASESQSTAAELGHYSPIFLWLLRDFYLELHEDGKIITPQDYLEIALKPMEGRKKDVAAKNEIRESIRAMFPVRECFTLVRPVNEEHDLQRLDQISIEKVRPEFRAGLDALTKFILEQTKPKQVGSTVMTGPLFAWLVQSYLDALNAGAVPTIFTSWQCVEERECRRAYDLSIQEYRNAFDNSKPPEEWALREAHDSALQKALVVFKNIALGSTATRREYKSMLHDTFKKQFEEYKANAFKEADMKCSNGCEIISKKLRDACNMRGTTLDQVLEVLGHLVVEYENLATGPTKTERLASLLYQSLEGPIRDLTHRLANQNESEKTDLHLKVHSSESQIELLRQQLKFSQENQNDYLKKYEDAVSERSSLADEYASRLASIQGQYTSLEDRYSKESSAWEKKYDQLVANQKIEEEHLSDSLHLLELGAVLLKQGLVLLMIKLNQPRKRQPSRGGSMI